MLTNRRSTLSIPPSAQAKLNPNPDHQTTPAPQSKTPSLLTTTTATLPGYTITRVLGTVHGSTVISRKDTKAFLKAVGGSSASEARSLTHTLYAARDTAMERMVRDVVGRGGNAVVGVGFGEGEMLGFAQVSVWGTAVLVERGGVDLFE